MPIFLLCRNQGAVLSGVAPEDLMDYKDYLQWSSKVKKYCVTKEEAEFNSSSAEAWTSVLMQVINVSYRVSGLTNWLV